MRDSLTIFGSGSSMGIPVLGCDCKTCRTSKRRTRAASLLKWKGKQILIDCGPDIREQGLMHGLDHVDAIFLTHVHFDHVSGLDDMRPFLFKQNEKIPVHLSSASYDELKNRCDYMLDKFTWKIDEFPFDTFAYTQTGMEVLGFRIGKFAYFTDICDYDESIFDFLSGVETLVLSALRIEQSHNHLSIDEAIEFSARLKNPRTHLTHIAHDLDIEKAEKRLPNHITLAYDGLQLEI